ncbi:hypothetical protein LOZ53_003689 [Ophidiomyces ophidiicola]|nr:hypothetical protein LOZ64_005556 [Ophidiomyces ophidiicola]KAI1975911.1 hypothetical protein LOZ55_004503 [Ophidiomyces ophidiicola]KAI1977950.1 hypothetical protein LOZ54_006392 [Ophidiomyces ophidiicola]KAI1989108.1 hypothetical protein LOZ53_003689 [Ophidiomyces ophidiicola]KAI2002966.1 hypothetical protein LOZ51_000038 [Ophidiomyces ophidiicola]
MPLQFTAAASSRITKAGTRTSKRHSPFDRHRRTKPGSQTSTKLSQRDDNHDRRAAEYLGDRLPDMGPSHHISETTLVRNVIQAIQYIQNTMFTDMPDSRTGMNSTRIAEVLNFRRALPPIVSIAHVHMLLDAPTKVEREIVELIDSARLRRLFIPGRGSALAGLGDCLVLVEDWEGVVRNSGPLEEALKEKFIRVVRSNTKTSAVAASHFTTEECSSLVRAGFLVSPSSLAKSTSATINPSIPADAVLEESTDLETCAKRKRSFRDSSMLLSLPNLGPYLRLLSAGRSQMLAILEKSKYREAPLSLLKDRWDGSVEAQTQYGLAKRVRGESSGVLPGRTKKWKELFGMNFRWALEEALGAGLIEMFDTGSVGPGVRRL